MIYNPVANTFTFTDSSFGSHDESAWVKLRDNSILYADANTKTSERYIPSTNLWVHDGNIPVSLYDSIGETGSALLLPDGRAFFTGATGATAYYTPSGNSSPGTWAAGPHIPDSLGCFDAPTAMMVNGKIICTFSPKNSSNSMFPSPTYFYEFNYLTNTFTQLTVPGGGDTLTGAPYPITMLDLPDGGVLLGSLSSNYYFEYIPGGTALAAGKPTINKIIKINCDTFMATGTLFNGITEGAAYGDDWQMATNYPLVRLKSGNKIYYARTYNWNRTGVQTGTLADTTYFTLPIGLPTGTYSLFVVANGNPSDSVSFSTCGVGVPEVLFDKNDISLSPNPTNSCWNIVFSNKRPADYFVRVFDLNGKVIYREENASAVNATDFPEGIYFIDVYFDDSHYYLKAVKN